MWEYIVLLVLYIIADVNYFLRVFYLIGKAKIELMFQKKQSVHDTTSITGLCTTQDCDIFFRHMNNARFMRDLDFARFDYYFRTGIYSEMQKVDGHALQGASTVRYRRPIPLFSIYTVKTKVVYWDEKTLYLEHQFITPDKFVRAVLLSKQVAININFVETLKKLSGSKYQEPVIPQEVQEWNASMETLSSKFRKTD